MVRESHYTVDTDQRQQGEVHAAISIYAGSCGRHSRLSSNPSVLNSANRARRLPFVRNLAKLCCFDQDAGGGV
jgi:hypothetical protein